MCIRDRSRVLHTGNSERVNQKTKGEIIIDVAGRNLSITDNGGGMSVSQVRNAISAGFSEKGKADELGLFGNHLSFNSDTIFYSTSEGLYVNYVDENNTNVDFWDEFHIDADEDGELLLDSRSPFNEGNVFVPDENYEVFLNKSSVIDLVSYSGVIIEKKPAGFVVRGYDTTNPYFKYFKVRELSDDPVVNVGGISESFVRWFADQSYVEGQIVEFDNEYYTVKVAHRSGVNFEVSNFVKLAELPVSGGRNAFFRRQFDKTPPISNSIKEIAYGTLFTDIQSVVDFLLGYGHWLETRGFDFNFFNPDINLVENWTLSAKEFLFWTTQNWANNSVITLSPAGNHLSFKRSLHVSDNIFDSFYDYTLLKADGTKLLKEFVDVYSCLLYTSDAADE